MKAVGWSSPATHGTTPSVTTDFRSASLASALRRAIANHTATKDALVAAFDRAIVPAVFVAGGMLGFLRRKGLRRLSASRSALLRVGVLPVIDHYYEPLFNPAHLRHGLEAERDLPGIDWNIEGQLSFLRGLDYAAEVLRFPTTRQPRGTFFIDNGNFEYGDADFWYSVIRRTRPKRIIEVGSGHSTLVGREAIRANALEDHTYSCQQTCIDPYEMPWLEKCGITVVRRRVEEIGLDLFLALEANDILFIDSSHVIRPQGDVLTEMLMVLPRLRSGVIVHFHDIFSPRDYPAEWVTEAIRLWNEQYLLEAFLSHNRDWEILAALNLLRHRHLVALQRVAPHAGLESLGPMSFYIRRR